MAVPAVAQEKPDASALAGSAVHDANVVQQPPSDVVAAILAFASREKRMTVPVRIDGEGPYPFVIDTGAERTVIASELADSLGLSAGPVVTVAALSGRESVGTFLLPSISVDSFPRTHGVAAPGFGFADLGAHGLLGLDFLAGHAVRIDFDRSEMSVRPSRGKRHHFSRRNDEIVVRAKREHGALVLTDAHYGHRRIRVLIDTGTAVTIGNAAMRDLVTRRSDLSDPITITSVTGRSVTSRYARVDGISIGSVGFSEMPIAFVEAAPFDLLVYHDEPALILGMEVLRAFRYVEIDFAASEIRFGIPRANRYRFG
ncbi:aspartyl protease family protein [Stakelama saccharophila]|uniref:Aspartyl protease family protein n=1 Tax=Stakelama saccharophila TaxID=3075605 RepID=A0ABZ0BAH2_9SPHN|nr:aspartyl protease family protein [Stakelama sp. W311]WNO54267.1 aspartyl protease family protein [Stakelama sp. W311]